MSVEVFWTAEDWARAIAALPAEGPLPSRVVLVPRERVAHTLRRELIEHGESRTLIGTLFLSPLAAATELLRLTGARFSLGEQALRPARLASLFAGSLKLRHFDLAQLRAARGWDEAFARTLGELEAAGLRPEVLPAGNPWKDLGVIWAALNARAGESITAAQVFVRAAEALERDPGAWPYRGPVLSVATGLEPAGMVRFLNAIPGRVLALHGARPLRTAHLDRVEAIFGREARQALQSANPPQADDSERSLLVRYLFEEPEVLAQARRPRSHGPDGTLHLEAHAGVDAELEATADWVAAKVLEGIPLEAIAVLTPTDGPLKQLVAERLARLLAPDGATLAVQVAGGIPMTASSGGARALAAVRALRGHLSAASVAELLPSLRLAESDAPDAPASLSRAQAFEIVAGLGTSGGNPERPGGALDWQPRLARWIERVQEELAQPPVDAAEAGDQRRAAGLLERLQRLMPGVEALHRAAVLVVEEAPLERLWPAIRTLLEQMEDSDEAPASALADAALVPFAALDDGAAGGDRALQLVEDALCGLHLPRGRYGEPAVFVGTLAEADGLRFSAVRVIGLTEGTVPASRREDPVLPEKLREVDAALRLPTTGLRAVEDLQRLHRVLRGARGEIVLSAPRVDLRNTQCHASSVFIEAGAAVGRPNPEGRREGVVPSLHVLERDAFGVARRLAEERRDAAPLSQAAWLDRAARSRALPGSWKSDGVLGLQRLDALRKESGGALDGWLHSTEPFPVLPGLSAKRPISASALNSLLGCPHQFLFQRVLRWEEPAALAPDRQIETLSYGTLFHSVAEQFFESHGAAFASGNGSLAHWQRLGEGMCESSFEAFVEQYSLVGKSVQDQELARLKRDLRQFLAYDWGLSGSSRRFVGVELGFGYDEPMPLQVGDATLFVHGWIDRVDVEAGCTIVRDLKTGRSHPRRGKEDGPTLGRDLQLAVYGMVLKALARKLKLPARVGGAYAYIDVRHDPERAFREDFDALQETAEEWLETAAELLEARLFPRTPTGDECVWCPFACVCGAPDSSLQCLENDGGELASKFLSLKLAGESQ